MTAMYALQGTPSFPQVEPTAGAWALCPTLRPVTVNDLQASGFRGVPFPSRRQGEELEELLVFCQRREEPVVGLSELLRRAPFFDPPPAGAVLSRECTADPAAKGGVDCSACPAQKGIANGVELATLFEAETPGLWHRHVLNVLLDPMVARGPGISLSPPRQALIWQALDAAIHSALAAAWYYKWLSIRERGIDYRQRPVEYAADAKIPFDVLFDKSVEFGDDCKIMRTMPKRDGPQPSPGTPRHPAYPSGHSTYAAAASEVLGCLFDGYTDPRPALRDIDWRHEFAVLADNIGIARLYGGVHWRSDHTFGQMLGKAVGQQVIRQLNESGIPARPAATPNVPKPDDIEDDVEILVGQCGEGREDYCNGIIPPPGDAPILQNSL